MPKDRKHPVNVEFAYAEGAPIAFINATKFGHLGADVFLDLAILDDQKLIQFLNGPDEPNQKVTAFVQYRIGMSIPTLLRLKRNIEEILILMKKAGTLPEGFDAAEG